MVITIVSVLFLAVLFAFGNPFMLYMPSGVEYTALAALAVLASVFVGFIFREEARDEREESLRARAARVGYLAGVVVLTLGIIVPVLSGIHADPWVVGGLAAMILARLASRAKSG